MALQLRSDATASVIVAFIILTIVLRRFDGNIDRAVRLITLGAILITVFAPIVMGFLTIIRIPYFAVVMLTESVSFAAVISPALCTFNNVCIGKKEYGYRVDSLKTK